MTAEKHTSSFLPYVPILWGMGAKKRKCKKRCKAAYAWNPSLMKGCQAACKQNPDLQPEDYLSSLPPDVVVGYYGIDDIPGADICGLPEAKFDPLCNPDAAKTEIPFNMIFVAAGILIVYLILS